MKNKFHALIFLIFALFLVVPNKVTASVPGLFTYQGILKDSSGNFLTGTYSMTFRIYGAATGGSNLWSETQSSVSVSSGRFSVILGSATDISLTFDQDYWLSVQVGSDVEMTPRQRLTSAGYAVMAEDVTGGKLTVSAHASDSHMSIEGVKSAHQNIAKVKFQLDAYTLASANNMGDLIVDSFNDASGISSGSSSGYSWRTSPNYDVVRDANYTDQTGTGATSASSSWNQTSYHPDKAVDNSSATGWLSAAVPSTSSPQWWKYDFGSGNAKTIKRVTFQQSNDNPAYYMPKDFSIQASNDDTNWTTLLTPASQTGWTSQEKRTFDFSNATAYRYWRIHITAKESGGEGVQLGEVELMTQASGSATIVSTVYSVFSAPTEAMVTADETLGGRFRHLLCLS
ncbi:MAG: hypothetical protein A2036_04295 [Omnitrophica bacterium GWA2_50_21]|nr:MAG: hypothetical protein A2036_04295 [Omnitrophica bacterium GWA2_50_21]